MNKIETACQYKKFLIKNVYHFLNHLEVEKKSTAINLQINENITIEKYEYSKTIRDINHRSFKR
eukprot:UN09316